MKIGIITLSVYNNYGNRLQNYALQMFLLNYAIQIDTLWVNTNIFLPERVIWNRKNIIKYILNKGNTRKWLGEYYAKDCIREYNIKKFSDRYIDIVYNDVFDKVIDNNYDFFIVGSDQVWNPNFWKKDKIYKEAMFLKFTETKKRIAYAASIAVPSISQSQIEFFKNGIKEMQYISVREQSGARLIKELTGRNVPVLVDPTLLLFKDEWKRIQLKPEWYKDEKYILTYFLGNPSEQIETIAKNYGYKIYNLMDRNNLNLYTSRVEEFVYLIEHAQLVCTDSFHACVFSILMNTPFLVVNRKQQGMVDMSSRIDTLLELFHFEDRYLTDGRCELSDEQILHMDFSMVESIQERERKRSEIYIKNALGLQ